MFWRSVDLFELMIDKDYKDGSIFHLMDTSLMTVSSTYGFWLTKFGYARKLYLNSQLIRMDTNTSSLRAILSF